MIKICTHKIPWIFILIKIMSLLIVLRLDFVNFSYFIEILFLKVYLNPKWIAHFIIDLFDFRTKVTCYCYAAEEFFSISCFVHSTCDFDTWIVESPSECCSSKNMR